MPLLVLGLPLTLDDRIMAPGSNEHPLLWTTGFWAGGARVGAAAGSLRLVAALMTRPLAAFPAGAGWVAARKLALAWGAQFTLARWAQIPLTWVAVTAVAAGGLVMTRLAGKVAVARSSRMPISESISLINLRKRKKNAPQESKPVKKSQNCLENWWWCLGQPEKLWISQNFKESCIVLKNPI